ncbi:peptidase-like protein, partial [Candidatus Magnetomorum sp. HK-1]
EFYSYLLFQQNGRAYLTIMAESNGLTTIDDFWIDISAIDDPPYVANTVNHLELIEDQSAYTSDLLSWFGDIDNKADEIIKSIFENSAPEKIMATINGNVLKVNVLPNANGLAKLTILGVSNGQNVKHSLNIDILAVDDPPIVVKAINDLRVNEDASKRIIDFSQTFDDCDNNPQDMKFEIMNSNPQLIAVEINALNIQISFLKNQYGQADLTLKAISNNQFVSTTAKIWVDPVNDAPVGISQNLTVIEDSQIESLFLAQDIDNESLNYQIHTFPKHGHLHFEPSINNGFIYTAEANYFGHDIVLFTATDGNTISEPASVVFTIKPVNDLPLVQNILKAGYEDTVTYFVPKDFSDAFSDIDNDSLQLIQIISLPKNGLLKLNKTEVQAGESISLLQIAKLNYVPNSDYYGEDLFSWKAFDGTAWSENKATVQINVKDAPIGIGTIYKSAYEDEDVQFDASDLSGFSLDNSSYIKAVSIPKNGSLLFDSQKTSADHPFDGTVIVKGQEFHISEILSGELVYRPNNDFYGLDSLMWRASKNNVWSDDEQVIINIKPVNDPPTLTTVNFYGFEDNSLILDFQQFIDCFQDSDGDQLETIRIHDLPEYPGEFLINDIPQTLPIDILVTDELIFQAEANYFGMISFSIQAFDASLWSVSHKSLILNIQAVADTPQNFETTIDEDIISDIIKLERNPFDGNEVSHFCFKNIVAGIVTLSNGFDPIADNTCISYSQVQSGIRFLPAPNSNATGGFDFAASEDGLQVSAQSDYAHVTIHIQAVDDPPALLSSISDIILNEDAPDKIIDLSKIFYDPDNDIKQMQISVSKNSAAYLLHTEISEQKLKLICQKNQYGMAQIELMALSNEKSISTSFAVEILPVDDAPVVINPIMSVNYEEDDHAQSIDLLSVFADIDNDQIRFSLKENSLPSLASIVIQESVLNISLKPNAYGTATISIQGESNGKTVNDVFSLIVSPVDDPPLINNPISNIRLNEDAPDYVIDIQHVFTDPDSNDDNIVLSLWNNDHPELVIPVLSGKTLTLELIKNQYGTAEIVIMATSNGKSVSDSFLLSIDSINDAPEISAISNVHLLENSRDNILTVRIKDIDDNISSLQLSAQSDNPELLPTSNIKFLQTGPERTIMLTPKANMYGKARIYLKVSDKDLFHETAFDVYVDSAYPISIQSPFDGVQIPNSNSFTWGHEFTFDARIYPMETADIAACLYSKAGENNSGIHIFLNPDFTITTIIENAIMATNLTCTSITSSPFLNNAWSHIAITADGNKLKMYINGELDCETQITGHWDLNYDSAAIIGADFQNMRFLATYSFEDDFANNHKAYYQYDRINHQDCVAFKIDAIRIWPVKQSADEILSNMYKRVLDSSPMGYWYAKDNIIADYSGNNNHGFFFKDVPALSQIDDQKGSEDTLFTIDFTVDQSQGSAADITTSVDITNTSLIPTTNISGDLKQRTITLFPAKNKNGETGLRLIADNGTIKRYMIFNVNVEAVNDAPLADAGPDFTVNEETLIQLDATKSIDSESNNLTYYWKQITGPIVEISEANQATASFMSPAVDPIGASVSFELIVTDEGQLTDTDKIMLYVMDVPKKFTITTNAQIGGQISPQGPLSVMESDTVNFQIIPDDGYDIQAVWLDGLLKNKITYYTLLDISDNHAITAVFRPIKHKVVILESTNGQIIPDQTVIVDEGSDLNLHFVAEANYEIQGIKINGDSLGRLTDYTLRSIAKDYTISASFIEQPVIIALAGANGQIQPSGIVQQNMGESQAFKIIPDSGYKIDKVFMDDKQIFSPPYIFFNLRGNHSISVSFNKYQLSINTGINGNITPSIKEMDAGADYTLFISANKGFEIDTLTVDGKDINPVSKYTFWDVSADHSISATFKELAIYNIQVSANEGGSISPNGHLQVLSGDDLAFQIIPDDRYLISNLILDGQAIAARGDYVLNNISKDHEIIANFTPETWFTIKSNAGIGGQINPSGLIEKKQGDLQIFQIVPDNNYQILNVFVDDVPKGPLKSFVLKADANHDISVTFEPTFSRSIEGYVLAEYNQSPLADYWLELWQNDTFVKAVKTDSLGFYIFNDLKPSDQYIVSVWPPSGSNKFMGQFYVQAQSWNDAQVLSVIDADLSGIDFSLKQSDNAGFSGKIFTSDSFPIAMSFVDVFLSDMTYVTQAATDQMGYYTVTGLNPDTGYILSYWHEASNKEFYYTAMSKEPVVITPTLTVLQNIDIIVTQGESISGQLKDIFGNAIGGLQVNAWSDFFKAGNSSLSDEQGKYTITGLTPVSDMDAFEKGYIVDIQAIKYPYQVYPYSEIKELGEKIASNKSQIDFKLRPGNSIFGKVRDRQNAPLPDVEIIAWSKSQPGNMQIRSQSDANGDYSLLNLSIADDYILVAFPEQLAPQYYQLQNNVEQAILVDNTNNKQDNIDFIIDTGSQIKGNLFINTLSTPAPSNIRVNIVSNSNQFNTSVTSDDLGHFEFIGLDSDTNDYVLSILENGWMPYISENLSPSNESMTIILQAELTITGSFYNEAQTTKLSDLSDCLVHAQSTEHSLDVYADIENSMYTLTGLKAGTWIIEVQAPGFIELKQTLYLTESLNAYDLMLKKKPVFSMSGSIIGLNEDESLKLQAWSSYLNSGKVLKITGSGQSMNFSMTGLLPSNDYTLELTSENYPNQYYNNAESRDLARVIDLSENSVSGIIFRLSANILSEISGEITFPENSIHGQDVTIRAISSNNFEAGFAHVTFKGNIIEPYSISGLSKDDQYLIYLSSSDFIAQYYDGSETGSYSVDDALPLSIKDTAAYNIHFKLMSGRKITGTVTDKQGNGLANYHVEAWSEDAQTGQDAFTDSNGQFVISGLSPASDYIIHLQFENNPLYYYAESGTVTVFEQADTINLMDSVASIKIMITQGYQIQGTVRNTNNAPLSGIWVYAWSEIYQTGNGVYTDAKGNYVIKGLPQSNDYKLTAKTDTTQAYLSKTYQNIATGSISDFVLLSKAGYVLSGVVYSYDNSPLKNARIDCESASDASFFSWTKTDALGHFTFPILPHKTDYDLKVWPGNNTDAYHRLYPIELSKNTEIKIQLTPGLLIKGNISQKLDGKPLKNIIVRIASESLNMDLEILSDKNGIYQWPNAPQVNDYIITAAGTSKKYLPVQLINQSPSDSIDIILEQSGSIKGHVKDFETSSAIFNAVVEIYSLSGDGLLNRSGVTMTDAQGKFQIDHLTAFDQQGKALSDYVISVKANDYPEFIRNGKKCGNIVNIILAHNIDDTITGSCHIPDNAQLILDLFYKNGDFIKSYKVKDNGQFVIYGLNARMQYEIRFSAFIDTQETIRQWLGEDHQGSDDRNMAMSVSIGDIIDFQFKQTKKRKRLINNSNRISQLYSSTQSFRMLKNKNTSNVLADIDVPPISANSNISVSWDDDDSNQKYYTSFAKEATNTFSKLNTFEMQPIKTRKITSADLQGDNVSYYFHVAPVDREGRIGQTTTIAFRIDTISPQNVKVIPPEFTTNRNIPLILGASGASEIYISNLAYNENGQWENFRQKKAWEIGASYGSQKIYVSFKDRAANQSRVTSETLYKEPIPTFTLTARSGENGKIKPSANIEANMNSNQCFEIQADNGFEIDRLIIDGNASNVISESVCLTNIQAMHDIQVTFKSMQYLLRSASESNGQIFPAGDISIQKGHSQTYVITPKNGYQIQKLTIDLQEVNVTDNSYTLSNVNEDHDLFVTFKKVYNISATVSGKGKIEPEGIVTVESGQPAWFNILPDMGYDIESILIDGQAISKGSLYTFMNVTDNHSIHAAFVRGIHAIKAIKGFGGIIEPEGIINVASGSSQHFTIRPDQGYTINHLIVDGKNIANSSKRSGDSVVYLDYNFTEVTEDHTIAVSFLPVMHFIHASAGTNGIIAPSGDVKINDGMSITFTLFPSAGYILDTLLLDNKAQVAVNNQITVENVFVNHDLHATFKRVFTITSMSGANGHIEPEGSIFADEKQDLIFTFYPDTSYSFAKLTVDGIEKNVTSNRFVLTNICQDQSIIATFKLKQFKIVSQAGPYGKIEPAGDFLLDAGSNKTFFIQPDVGCQIKQLKVNNKAVLLSGNQYTIESIAKDYTLNAEFVVINNAPVISNANLFLFEDTPISGQLTGNDLDNDMLTFHIQSPPVSGALNLMDSTGIFVYTPNAQYFGSDAFTFFANDGKIESNRATISINITSVNDIPQSYDGKIQLNEDSFISAYFTAFDADNDLLSYAISKQASKGVVVITSQKQGTFVYTPNPDANGEDLFMFTVSDNKSTSSPSVIRVTIDAINDLPRTSDQQVETGVSESIEITLLATDNDSDTLEFYLKTLANYGQISCMGYTINEISEQLMSPHILYIPNPAYRGLDNFSYYASDGSEESNISEIQIQIGGSNILTKEDTPIDLTDMLADSISITYAPQHGVITVDTAIIYTPQANYNGFDSFKYSHEGQEKVFTIYISPVNDPPLIADLQSIYLMEDTFASITIFATDVDDNDLTFKISQANHGKISGTPPHYFYYPDENYNGIDTVIVQVSDQSDTSQLTITLNILPVNDPPMVSDIAGIITEEDIPVSIDLTALDIDSLTFSYSVSLLPEHGIIKIIDQQMIYTPNSDYYGTDRLAYQAFDGYTYSKQAFIQIAITSSNDPPQIFSKEFITNEDQQYNGKFQASDKENDPLTFHFKTQPENGQINMNPQTGTYTYVPAENYFGSDTFSFYASDGKLNSEPAQISITIQPVNDAPTVSDLNINLNEDERSQEYQLIASDIDNLTLTYQLKNLPQKGEITLDAITGKLIYMPYLNENGSDVFTYMVTDHQDESAIASVFVQIKAVNDAPVAKDSSLKLDEDTEAQGNMMASDLDMDTLSFIIVTSPEKGDLEIIDATQGKYKYIPHVNKTGMDSFIFQVTDGNIYSNQGKVLVTIQPVNDAPTVSDTQINLMEDKPAYGKLYAEDIDGDTLTYQIMKNGEKGTLTLTNPSTGEMIYSPKQNQNGLDTIQFSVNDGVLQSATATLTLIIAPVNDMPYAIAQEHMIPEDMPFSITLTAVDIDNDLFSYNLREKPQHGSLTVLSSQNIIYTPEQGFWGIDEFTFTANDGLLDSMPAKIRLHVAVPDVDILTSEDNSISIANHLTMITDAYDFILTKSPEKGFLSGEAPNLTYIPNANEHGHDSFTFKVKNSPETFTLLIYIKSINDAPVITATETIICMEDMSKTLTVHAIDADQDTLIYRIDEQPSHGKLSEISNTQLIYTPFENYNGIDSFTFSVSDEFSTDDSGKIIIQVKAVNDPPQAIGQKVNAVEETTVSIVLNGLDIDGDSLIYQIKNPTESGDLQINGNLLDYTPEQNFSGLDQFTFTVMDSTGVVSEAATVLIDVHNTNDIPIAHAAIFSIKQGEILSGQLIGNDLDNDMTIFSIQRQPENGILVFTNPFSGKFKYIPDSTKIFQSDNFSYHIFDSHVYSNTANVYISIDQEDIPNQTPSVTISLNNQYQEGDIYTIRLISEESAEVLYNENGSTNELKLSINPGRYRLISYVNLYELNAKKLNNRLINPKISATYP